jgi:hypothetical protein
MQQPWQPIIRHLFQVPTLEEVSRQQLEAFVENYPAFGIGHYLLSAKLRAEGSARFPESMQRTSLYFPNPLWLKWLLENENGVSHPQAEEAPAVTVELPVVEEVETPVAEEVQTPVAEAIAAPAPESVETTTAVEVAQLDEHGPAEAEAETGDDLAEALGGYGAQEDAVGEEEVLTQEEKEAMTSGEGEMLAEVEPLAEPEPLVEPEPLAEPEVFAEPSAADRLLQSIREARDLRESLQRINEHLDGKPEESEAETMGPEEEAFAPPAEPAPVFEPFHTIDYFASQGIRLSVDENPNDQLGKQLKSFTDWLKVMRRLPQQERVVAPDRVAEQAIQSIAEHSIEGRDVLTETMAEVFVKQGMREKARAVYDKLSLLNPDKRAYFAAKIEQLKKL